MGIINVSDTVLDVIVPGSNTVETLTMLFNYTVYEIAISANTIGEGPNDTLVQRTAENGMILMYYSYWYIYLLRI